MSRYKNINVNKSSIIEYWNTKGLKIKPRWDFAGSNCWVCDSLDNLERSHIIPRVLGGEDKVSNLVLLCRQCNCVNPETIYEEDFWLWFNGQMVNDFADDETKIYKFMYNRSINDEIEIIQNKITDNDEFFKLFADYLKTDNTTYPRNTATRAVSLRRFFDIFLERNKY